MTLGTSQRSMATQCMMCPSSAERVRSPLVSFAERSRSVRDRSHRGYSSLGITVAVEAMDDKEGPLLSPLLRGRMGRSSDCTGRSADTHRSKRCQTPNREWGAGPLTRKLDANPHLEQ